MSLNSLFLKVKGLWGHNNSDGDDAAQMANRPFTLTVDMSSVGAAADNILIAKVLAPITVTAIRVVPSVAVTSATSDPEFDLSVGDLAAGALAVVGEFVDVSATALVARTAISNTTLSNTTVDKGEGLYLTVETNGTPANMGETGYLTFIVEWEYTG